MNRMFPTVIAVLVAFAAAKSWAQNQIPTEPQLGLPASACTEGWISLFDGEALFGWQPTGDADWKVSNGAITVTSGAEGFLNTTTQFANFELQLEYKCPTATNSGVFIRTSTVPKSPKTDCYEINIAPADNPFPTGSIVARQKTETLIENSNDAWRSLKIVADGPTIQVWIDGRPMANYTDDSSLGRGHIGLQFRGDPVAFRNIRLRPLGLKSIFNGQDLAGWSDAQSGNSRFFVEDGHLRVQDGRGQLESTDSYADFVLQLECKTHAAGLNSGIFFRCLPGDEMMGYESQIHNVYLNDDRNQPADCGTGGIFRRQNARTVVADDLDWFHMTIVAEGAHFATWVNGHQVVDWTDDREANDNPRKGLRLTAGTIMIQGHDPTTNLSFRNLRIGETPER